MPTPGLTETKSDFRQSDSPGARGGAGRQVDPLIGLHIRIYMCEQDGVGWAEIREVL
jgi:hypothetical protein